MKRVLGLCALIATASITLNNVNTKNENVSLNDIALVVELKKNQVKRHQRAVLELERDQLWTAAGVIGGGYLSYNALAGSLLVLVATRGQKHLMGPVCEMSLVSGLATVVTIGLPTVYLFKKWFDITQQLKKVRAQRDQAAIELESHLEECFNEREL